MKSVTTSSSSGVAVKVVVIIRAYKKKAFQKRIKRRFSFTIAFEVGCLAYVLRAYVCVCCGGGGGGGGGGGCMSVNECNNPNKSSRESKGV